MLSSSYVSILPLSANLILDFEIVPTMSLCGMFFCVSFNIDIAVFVFRQTQSIEVGELFFKQKILIYKYSNRINGIKTKEKKKIVNKTNFLLNQ
jgi:hypothetical protein